MLTLTSAIEGLLRARLLIMQLYLSARSRMPSKAAPLNQFEKTSVIMVVTSRAEGTGSFRARYLRTRHFTVCPTCQHFE